MFPAGQLKALQARKQELLQDSEMRRQLLMRECTQIQARLEWLDRGVTLGRRVLPYLAFALPLLGMWRKRGPSGVGSLVLRIANALPIARRLATMWRSFHPART
jgi:hypothetical protein